MLISRNENKGFVRNFGGHYHEKGGLMGGDRVLGENLLL